MMRTTGVFMSGSNRHVADCPHPLARGMAQTYRIGQMQDFCHGAATF
jgi:hypothetical protein